MTIAEFLAWEPDDRSGALWQLRDGEPEMMAPASDPHGSIQSELAFLITTHFRATISMVAEIVVLRSTSIAAEVLRRGPDGAWPQQPEIIAEQGELRLDSIGFVAPLRDAYRTTGLA